MTTGFTLGSRSCGAAGLLLAEFDRPRVDERTTVAVFADSHLTTEAEGTWKCYHRTESRLRSAVADANERGVDAVLLAGDLTKDGRPAEFDAVDELLGDLDAPYLGVPGNHDVPKPKWDPYDAPSPERFAWRYAAGSLPFVERVGGLDIVGVNTASAPDGRLRDTHEGVVSDAQLTWLAETLPELENPVVLLHHCLTHPSAHGERLLDADLYQVRNAREVRDVLTDGAVELVLSGHLHWPAVGTHGSLQEVIAPAICSFPQSYLIVDVGTAGTTVSLVPLADRAGLEEAYVAARDGKPHGRAIADWAGDAMLDDLLATDERLAATAYQAQ
ncbi:metallophosphoesterase family protein [Natronomonas sp. EA1]|uniref:metallophosphoesterase family protein n=1 Tax=Natronomonas sp. EA1 TaxID=3421655 RepID=UPI003EBC9E4E